MAGKDVGYFPHYINARNDRKIRKARLQLGIESYAIYFMTLEVLREQKDYKYPLADLDILSDDFGTTLQKIQVIVLNYGLFDIDPDEQFFSPAQKLAMLKFDQTKEINRLKGIKSGEARRKKLEEQVNELKQLENFSQPDSTKPQFDNGSTTDEQVSKKVSKEVKKRINNSLNERIINNFDSFVSYVRANYVNKEIIQTKDRHTSKVIRISVSQNGYLYDINNSEDFKGSRAKEIWKSLYSLALKGELNLIREETA